MRLGMQIWMRCSGSDWHEDTQKHPGVVQAVQQALTDKELELAAVSSAGAAESGAQSASYLQKEIAVLKCRNERLGHESCRLRDKLQTQARGLPPLPGSLYSFCHIWPHRMQSLSKGSMAAEQYCSPLPGPTVLHAEHA